MDTQAAFQNVAAQWNQWAAWAMRQNKRRNPEPHYTAGTIPLIACACNFSNQ